MTDPVARIARAAAQRLTGQAGPGLQADVEAELYRDRARPERYVDPVSLGALIVAVADLAWSIHTQHKSRSAAPTAELIARTIRVSLQQTDTTPAEERDAVIDIIVEEALQAAATHEPDPPAE